MKRILAIILSVLLLIPAACADDYSAMSYEELLALRDAITAEIMSRPEWKSVNVPEGSWKIGEDIPEGTYSINAPAYSSVKILDEKGKNIATHYIFYDSPVGKITLKKGWTLESKGPITMSPPLSLGF